MQYRLWSVLLVAIVVLAGCVAPVGGDRQATGPTPDRADAPHRTVTDAPVVNTSAGPDPLIVSIEADGDASSATHSVLGALAAWETVTDGDTPITVTSDVPAPEGYLFGTGSDPVEPDLVVRFADDRLYCGSGGQEPSIVCADDATGDGPATATISPGLTEAGFEAAIAEALDRATDLEASPEGMATREPAFADPWPERDTVTVTVENEVNPDRDLEPLVAETLQWWEAHDDRWGNYTTDWALVDDADADLTVVFVDEVQRCGGHDAPEKLLGCAPVLHTGNLAEGTERVRIKGGYTDGTTLHVLKHEFGHVYGLSHGVAPEDVMAASISTTRLPEPDATERE